MALWPEPMPPYGRELLELRRAGRKPADIVFVVDAWCVSRYLRERWDCFAIPVLHHGPVALHYLRGLDVMLIHSDPDVLGLAMRIADAQPASFEALPFAEWARVTGDYLDSLKAA